MKTKDCTVKTLKRLLLPSLISTTLAVSGMVSAGPLADLYQLALENDPQLKRAEAEFMAGQEAPIQGRAGLLPRVTFSANTSHSENPNPRTGATGSTGYSVSLTQPIYNAANYFTFKRSELIADRAATLFEQVEQEIIIRSVEAYLEVLRSMSTLDNAQAQERALQRRLDQVNAQFEVGLIAITDVQEAQAAYDLAVVQRIDAEGSLSNSYEALERLAGQPFNDLAYLSPDFPVVPVEPTDPQPWIEKALEGNLNIELAETQSEIERRNAQAKRGERLPTVSLGLDHENGRSHGTGSNKWSDNSTIALSISVPLFAGGGLSSQQRQAEHEQIASVHQSEDARRAVIEGTRSLVRTLQTSAQGVKARQQSILSRETALRATEEGFNVGTRNVVDVLQAEQNLFEARQAYENARIDHINALFLFKQTIGTLSPDDLFALDEWLVD